MSRHGSPGVALAFLAALLSGLAICLVATSCATTDPGIRQARDRAPQRVERIVVTGYCNCPSCGHWRRRFFGSPVHATGPLKGRPVQPALTSTGTRAHYGTVRVTDLTRFPYGTLLEIPDYGRGRVEDRPRLDATPAGATHALPEVQVWFANHSRAIKWDRQELDVKVWLPTWAETR